jgi:hypothetical protein
MAIVYTLVPNADGTQRTNYPNGDYVPALNLPVPQNVTISNVLSNSMRVNWTMPSGVGDADGFIIQMWQDGVSTTWTDVSAPVPTVSAGARSVTQTGLLPGTRYGWRIAAKNGPLIGTFVEQWI